MGTTPDGNMPTKRLFMSAVVLRLFAGRSEGSAYRGFELDTVLYVTYEKDRQIHDSITMSIPRWSCQNWPVSYRPTRGFVKYASASVNRRIRSLVIGRERARMHAVCAVLAMQS